MSIDVLKSYYHRSPDKEVANFVTSDVFAELSSVIANVFPGNWAASFLNYSLSEDFMLTWINGAKNSGVGFVIAQKEDVKFDESGNAVMRRGTKYPELKLADDNKRLKPVQQLTLHTGSYSLSSYLFPPDVVSGKSGRFLSAKHEIVSMGHSGLDVQLKDAIGIKVCADGDFLCYERGELNSKATSRLSEAWRRSDLYREMSSIS